MTAPTEQPAGLDANARGIVVLVVAVAVGFLLLWQGGTGGGGGSTEVDASAPSTTIDTSAVTDGTGTTTLPEAPSTTETTVGGRQPGEVTVLVLNGGLDVVGGAGTISETIGAAGYQMGTPANATDYPNVSTTAVYFQEGFEAEATAVAEVLGKDSSIVQPVPDPVPGPGAESSNVVVVLGADAPSPGETPETTEPG